MRTLLVLVAGLSVSAAWSSQVAGGTIGKVANTGATSTSTIKGGSVAPAVPAKQAARASSAASSTAKR